MKRTAENGRLQKVLAERVMDIEILKELALQYPRYGYRRIQVFMGRRGHKMSTDRARIVCGVCIGSKYR